MRKGVLDSMSARYGTSVKSMKMTNTGICQIRPKFACCL